MRNYVQNPLDQNLYIGALNDSRRDEFNSPVARLRKDENLNERAKSVLENKNDSGTTEAGWSSRLNSC